MSRISFAPAGLRAIIAEAGHASFSTLGAKLFGRKVQTRARRNKVSQPERSELAYLTVTTAGACRMALRLTRMRTPPAAAASGQPGSLAG